MPRLAPRPLLVALALAFVVALLAPARPLAARARVVRDGTMITAGNERLSVRYNLARGLAEYRWGERPIVRNAYSSVAVAGTPGRTVYSFQGTRRAIDGPLSDAIGRGIRVEVTTEIANAGIRLVQEINVYDDLPFLTQRVRVESSTPGGQVAVEQIEVLAASAVSQPGGAVATAGAGAAFYQAPFYNNDDYALIPNADARGSLSYWLGGVIEADGAGFVVGTAETRRWKSAVWYDGPSGSFSAHSGTRSPVDRVPPAPVRGARVESALFAAGWRANHQDGLADLMRAVAANEPPLPAPALPPPVGWSAWYNLGLGANETTVRGVADFVAGNWKGLGYRYINLDAGWNLADGDTRADPAKFPGGMERLVADIHERGLLAGGYYIPFAISPSLLDQQAPGSEYRYRDMLVRDAAGQPLRASILDWEYVLDTTHPGAAPLLYLSAKRLVDYGFDFVKLDFLQIGTQDGVRFDKDATAMEAFHRGMAAFSRAWQEAGRPIFVSAAISPLYVQPYVHARRVGNDVEFGQARQAKNVALSWFTALLYHRNDPDNAVVRPGWFPGYNERLAKLHATMAALGGTLFITGDDPRELSPERAALVTNASVLALTRTPLLVLPLSPRGEPPPVWHARAPNGDLILGVFNWDGDRSARHTLRLTDLGLSGREVYTVTDLWAEREIGRVESTLILELPAQGVALLRLRQAG